MKPWWRDDKYIICGNVIDVDDATRHLYARQTANGWEYAITAWDRGRPELQLVIRNGEALVGDDFDRFLDETYGEPQT